jgi:hypothetical protein
MQELFKEKILRIYWDLPIEPRVYEEIGKVMVQILSLMEKVEYADTEGAIVHVKVTEDQEEGIRKMRETLYYVDLWFEGEDHEKVKVERMMRWAERGEDFTPDTKPDYEAEEEGEEE